MNFRPSFGPWTQAVMTTFLLMNVPACTLTGRPKDGDKALPTPPTPAAPMATSNSQPASAGSASAPAMPPPAAKSQKPRVAPPWQDTMQSEKAAGAWSEAWGLFSEGGWVDAGQIIVLASPPKARLIIVEPGKKDVSIDRSLSEAELQSLGAVVGKAASLKDIEERVFDAVTFEFVAATDDHITQRLYIRTAGVQPHPDHDALINAFQALRPKQP